MERIAKVAKRSKAGTGRRGSAPGEHRGGRQKGTSNRATAELREELAALRKRHPFDNPIMFQVKVMAGLITEPLRDADGNTVMNGRTKKPVQVPADMRLRCACAKAVSPFLYPQLASVQAVDDEGNEVPLPTMIGAETYVKLIEKAMGKGG